MNNRKLLVALLILGVVVGGGVLTKIRSADPGHAMFDLKRVVSQAEASQLLGGLQGSIEGLHEALAWDYVFIGIYVFLFWLLLRLVAFRAGPEWSSQVLRPPWIRWAPLVAGLLDLAENRALKALLDGAEQPWIPPLKIAATLALWVVVAAILVALVSAWFRGARQAEEPILADAPASRVANGASLEQIFELERRALGKRKGHKTFGLAFSGGGIRAATFNLGILQALARLGILERFDYLSTVSGGGYIGAWLHQWIRHQGLPAVIGELAREPDERKPEPTQITHLRNFSNYLTPKLGFLSADTWATLATYVRNLVLNLVIIVALLGTLLLLPRAAGDSLGYLRRVFAGTSLERMPFDIGLGPAAIGHLWAFLAFVALAFTGIVGIGISLAGALTRSAEPDDDLTSQGAVQINTIAPLMAASVFAAYWLWAIGSEAPPWVWLVLTPIAYTVPWGLAVFVAYFVSDPEATLEAAGRKETCRPEDREGRERSPGALRDVWVPLGARFMGWAVPVGLVGGLALMGLTHVFSPTEGDAWSLWEVLAFGPSLVTVGFTMTAVLHIGLLGKYLDDHLREWLARAGAWISIYSLGWLALCGLAIYGPVLLAAASSWLKAVLVSGWLATSIWGARAGNSQQQGTGKAWHRPALKLAPWIFVIGLVVTLSWSLDRLLSRQHPEQWQAFTTAAHRPATGETLEYRAETLALSIARRGPESPGILGKLTRSHDELLDLQIAHNEFWIWILVLSAIALGLSSRVDINEFSMHQYYRNRLVRAYLGASNPHRKPNPFTGFDPEDDSRLGLAFDDGDPPLDGRQQQHGPIHLIGAALNLVHGSRLGWQERKAASFLFTPYYSGFALPADEGQSEPLAVYRRTCEVDRLTLGTAMAISGAAASPNMGYRSTPALTLLLTVFNVRLGWWLGNPAHEADWKRGGPGSALVALVAELFGLTSDASPNIYLSDGGHFENLGIYELVRRRCRFIIVTDASADPDLEFSDLGNAIRKCRTDFGAQIEINVDTLQTGEGKRSRRHCAMGKIRYAATEPGESEEIGYLFYIKPSLTGDEPEDIQQYARACQTFPHQTTADQFFDESQFESYRALGEHIGHRVFTAASSDLGPKFKGWENLITQLKERWVAPSAAVERSFSHHGETLNRHYKTLGADDNLRFLDAEMNPAWETLTEQALDTDGLPDTPDQLRSGFYFCSSLFQLMENVHLDLRLDDEYRHPDNRGWVNLFRQWARSPMMRATWAVSAGTYGSRFQTFCKRRFDLEMGRVTVERAAPGRDYLGQVVEDSPRFAASIRRRIATPPDDVAAYTWLAFDLELRHPPLKLPVGFGLLETRRDGGSDVTSLLYFQIHKHLRNTGLAQRGLATFGHVFPGVGPIAEDRRLEGASLRLWREFRNFFWNSQD